MAHAEPPGRTFIARAFAGVEDLVYVGLGVVLAGASLALLVVTIVRFGSNLFAGDLAVLSALIVAITLSLFVLRRRDTVDKISKP